MNPNEEAASPFVFGKQYPTYRPTDFLARWPTPVAILSMVPFLALAFFSLSQSPVVSQASDAFVVDAGAAHENLHHGLEMRGAAATALAAGARAVHPNASAGRAQPRETFTVVLSLEERSLSGARGVVSAASRTRSLLEPQVLNEVRALEAKLQRIANNEALCWRAPSRGGPDDNVDDYSGQFALPQCAPPTSILPFWFPGAPRESIVWRNVSVPSKAASGASSLSRSSSGDDSAPQIVEQFTPSGQIFWDLDGSSSAVQSPLEAVRSLAFTNRAWRWFLDSGIDPLSGRTNNVAHLRIQIVLGAVDLAVAATRPLGTLEDTYGRPASDTASPAATKPLSQLAPGELPWRDAARQSDYHRRLSDRQKDIDAIIEDLEDAVGQTRAALSAYAIRENEKAKTSGSATTEFSIDVSYDGDRVDVVRLRNAVTRDSLIVAGTVLLVLPVLYFYFHSVILALLTGLQILVVYPAAQALFVLMKPESTRDNAMAIAATDAESRFYRSSITVGTKNEVSLMNSLTILITYVFTLNSVFIIFDTFTHSGFMPTSGRRNTLTVAQRAAYTFRKAGTALTVGSLAALASFGPGCFSATPGVRLFSQQLMLLVVVSWALSATFFPAVVLVHHFHISGSRRTAQRQRDVIRRRRTAALKRSHDFRLGPDGTVAEASNVGATYHPERAQNSLCGGDTSSNDEAADGPPPRDLELSELLASVDELRRAHGLEDAATIADRHRATLYAERSSRSRLLFEGIRPRGVPALFQRIGAKVTFGLKDDDGSPGPADIVPVAENSPAPTLRSGRYQDGGVDGDDEEMASSRWDETGERVDAQVILNEFPDRFAPRDEAEATAAQAAAASPREGDPTPRATANPQRRRQKSEENAHRARSSSTTTAAANEPPPPLPYPFTLWGHRERERRAAGFYDRDRQSLRALPEGSVMRVFRSNCDVVVGFDDAKLKQALRRLNIRKIADITWPQLRILAPYVGICSSYSKEQPDAVLARRYGALPAAAQKAVNRQSLLQKLGPRATGLAGSLTAAPGPMASLPPPAHGASYFVGPDAAGRARTGSRGGGVFSTGSLVSASLPVAQGLSSPSGPQGGSSTGAPQSPAAMTGSVFSKQNDSQATTQTQRGSDGAATDSVQSRSLREALDDFRFGTTPADATATPVASPPAHRGGSSQPSTVPAAERTTAEPVRKTKSTSAHGPAGRASAAGAAKGEQDCATVEENTSGELRSPDGGGLEVAAECAEDEHTAADRDKYPELFKHAEDRCEPYESRCAKALITLQTLVGLYHTKCFLVPDDHTDLELQVELRRLAVLEQRQRAREAEARTPTPPPQATQAWSNLVDIVQDSASPSSAPLSNRVFAHPHGGAQTNDRRAMANSMRATPPPPPFAVTPPAAARVANGNATGNGTGSARPPHLHDVADYPSSQLSSPALLSPNQIRGGSADRRGIPLAAAAVSMSGMGSSLSHGESSLWAAEAAALQARTQPSTNVTVNEASDDEEARRLRSTQFSSDDLDATAAAARPVVPSTPPRFSGLTQQRAANSSPHAAVCEVDDEHGGHDGGDSKNAAVMNPTLESEVEAQRRVVEQRRAELAAKCFADKRKAAAGTAAANIVDALTAQVLHEQAAATVGQPSPSPHQLQGVSIVSSSSSAHAHEELTPFEDSSSPTQQSPNHRPRFDPPMVPRPPSGMAGRGAGSPKGAAGLIALDGSPRNAAVQEARLAVEAAAAHRNAPQGTDAPAETAPLTQQRSRKRTGDKSAAADGVDAAVPGDGAAELKPRIGRTAIRQRLGEWFDSHRDVEREWCCGKLGRRTNETIAERQLRILKKTVHSDGFNIVERFLYGHFATTLYLLRYAVVAIVVVLVAVSAYLAFTIDAAPTAVLTLLSDTSEKDKYESAVRAFAVKSKTCHYCSPFFQRRSALPPVDMKVVQRCVQSLHATPMMFSNVDQCGVCMGDGTSCADCHGNVSTAAAPVPIGGLDAFSIDACGQCLQQRDPQFGLCAPLQQNGCTACSMSGCSGRRLGVNCTYCRCYNGGVCVDSSGSGSGAGASDQQMCKCFGGWSGVDCRECPGTCRSRGWCPKPWEPEHYSVSQCRALFCSFVQHNVLNSTAGLSVAARTMNQRHVVSLGEDNSNWNARRGFAAESTPMGGALCQRCDSMIRATDACLVHTSHDACIVASQSSNCEWDLFSRKCVSSFPFDPLDNATLSAAAALLHTAAHPPVENQQGRTVSSLNDASVAGGPLANRSRRQRHTQCMCRNDWDGPQCTQCNTRGIPGARCDALGRVLGCDGQPPRSDGAMTTFDPCGVCGGPAKSAFECSSTTTGKASSSNAVYVTFGPLTATLPSSSEDYPAMGSQAAAAANGLFDLAEPSVQRLLLDACDVLAPSKAVSVPSWNNSLAESLSKQFVSTLVNAARSLCLMAEFRSWLLTPQRSGHLNHNIVSLPTARRNTALHQLMYSYVQSDTAVSTMVGFRPATTGEINAQQLEDGQNFTRRVHWIAAAFAPAVQGTLGEESLQSVRDSWDIVGTELRARWATLQPPQISNSGTSSNNDDTAGRAPGAVQGLVGVVITSQHFVELETMKEARTGVVTSIVFGLCVFGVLIFSVTCSPILGAVGVAAAGTVVLWNLAMYNAARGQLGAMERIAASFIVGITAPPLSHALIAFAEHVKSGRAHLFARQPTRLQGVRGMLQRSGLSVGVSGVTVFLCAVPLVFAKVWTFRIFSVLLMFAVHIVTVMVVVAVPATLAVVGPLELTKSRRVSALCFVIGIFAAAIVLMPLALTGLIAI